MFLLSHLLLFRLLLFRLLLFRLLLFNLLLFNPLLGLLFGLLFNQLRFTLKAPTLNRVINRNKKDLDDFIRKKEEYLKKSPLKLRQLAGDEERLLSIYRHNLSEGKDFDRRHRWVWPKGLTELECENFYVDVVKSRPLEKIPSYKYSPNNGQCWVDYDK